MFTPLQDPNEIKNSLNILIKQVRKGIPTSMDCTIGHPGKSKLHRKVFWHPQLKFWSCIEPEKMYEDAPDESKYWCVFGHEDPEYTSRKLGITCEINPPYKKINGRFGGLFAEDKEEKVHILHSGKIRASGGRESFFKFMQNEQNNFQIVDVVWPKKKEPQKYILLGGLDDSELQNKIAEFVHAVAQYKQQVR